MRKLIICDQFSWSNVNANNCIWMHEVDTWDIWKCSTDGWLVRGGTRGWQCLDHTYTELSRTLLNFHWLWYFAGLCRTMQRVTSVSLLPLFCTSREIQSSRPQLLPLPVHRWGVKRLKHQTSRNWGFLHLSSARWWYLILIPRWLQSIPLWRWLAPICSTIANSYWPPPCNLCPATWKKLSTVVYPVLQA